MVYTSSPHQLRLSLAQRYRQIRRFSQSLCQPLVIEDYGVQTMADVSPPKWHLAHTTWFFEAFLLVPSLPGYQVFHPRFDYLFNSYYEAMGAPSAPGQPNRQPRPQRGLLSRPTVSEVYAYRAYVDEAMAALIASVASQTGDGAVPGRLAEPMAALIELGLHHEQQHQELLLTDIKHILATNPLRPAYRRELSDERDGNLRSSYPAMEWVDLAGGLHRMGYGAADGAEHQGGVSSPAGAFAFDNEAPAHGVYFQDCQLGSRLVANGEYLEFMLAGGYRQPQWWLSDGWMTVQSQGWQAPLYWEEIDGEWWVMTLGGMRRVQEAEPVCHVSFYEADAFARWADSRLPTEAEWEVAAYRHGMGRQGMGRQGMVGNFVENNRLHPQVAPWANESEGPALQQMFGDVWEWTQSAYLPYPGFRPAAGAVGEYNGKFMCNQMVLRGGSCVTSVSHIRPTYRNFFPPASRWQFSGIRLARDVVRRH